jgi:putative DNA primase/helicase
MCELAGKAESVAVVELPDRDGGKVKDAADWIAAGGTAEALQEIILSAPTWVAPVEPDAGAGVAESEGARDVQPSDPVEAAKQGKPYAMTDLGNAERMVAYHGDKIRWDIASKHWRVWDGRRWMKDSDLKVGTLAADTARRIRLEAAEAPANGSGAKDLGAELFSWAVKSESRDRLSAIVEVVKSRPGVAVDAKELDANPWVLNVMNGTIDLKTGELHPHNRDDLITKLSGVEYRPGTRDERWERFLEDITGGDKELVSFLQVCAGYTLTGDTSEEKLFIVYGPEDSGKTTFLETLRVCLGEYSRTIQCDLLTRKRDAGGGGTASPELAALAGARLAAGSEMEQGREMAEALAKNLTGGEPITARHLYAEMFEFMPQFKLWLALNHCPKVSAEDGAMWRRVLRIGFEHTVPKEKRDKTLKPYLRDPSGGAPAILAWAVEGCLRWQKEGLKVPECVSRSTAAYRSESDPLALFFEDCLQVSNMGWTPWSAIWDAYCRHAQEMGTADRYRVQPKRLQERLRDKGCVSAKRSIGRGWTGVEVNPDWEPASGLGHGGHGGYGGTFKTFSRGEKEKRVCAEVSQPPCPPCGEEPMKYREVVALRDQRSIRDQAGYAEEAVTEPESVAAKTEPAGVPETGVPAYTPAYAPPDVPPMKTVTPPNPPDVPVKCEHVISTECVGVDIGGMEPLGGIGGLGGDRRITALPQDPALFLHCPTAPASMADLLKQISGSAESKPA